MVQNSTLMKSMNENTAIQLDDVRMEQMLGDLSKQTGQKVTRKDIEDMQKEGQKKKENFDKRTKYASVDQRDIIGAEEYRKDESKLKDGDLFGNLKMQAFAAWGSYGPAKQTAALTKFGTGIMSSTCGGWAGFLLKVANSSGLLDRVIQSTTGSQEADDIVEARAAESQQQAAPQTPNAKMTLAQHASEHAGVQQPDSLTMVAAAQQQNRTA